MATKRNGGELRSGWPKGLEEEIDKGDRGVGIRGSRRCRRGGQRARGGPGGAESTGGELGCPRLKTRQKRRCGAPAVERTSVDGEGDDTGPCGCFGKARGGRWPRSKGNGGDGLRSVRERERDPVERVSMGGERGVGGCVALVAAFHRQRQAGAGRARACAPWPHALLPMDRRLGVTGAWASWAGSPVGRPAKPR